MELGYKDMITFLWVRDWDKSVDFYTRILGLSRAFESDGWLELNLPNVKNGYLALNLWAKDEALPTNDFVTFRVLDLEAYLSHLKANGVHLKGDAREFYEEGMRMAKFYDPDKNVLTVSQVLDD